MFRAKTVGNLIEKHFPAIVIVSIVKFPRKSTLAFSGHMQFTAFGKRLKNSFLPKNQPSSA